MKRAVIGGFLALVSSIWAIGIGAYVQANLISQWGGGSRFWASASQLGVAVLFVIALAALALGLVMMGIAYVRKDK